MKEIGETLGKEVSGHLIQIKTKTLKSVSNDDVLFSF
jgi:hypothetical protein